MSARTATLANNRCCQTAMMAAFLLLFCHAGGGQLLADGADHPAAAGSQPPEAETPHREKLPINRGVLPSEKKVEQQPPNPQEILAAYGINKTTVAKFETETPLLESPVEQELLLRIMMRLAGIPLRSMEYWAKRAPPLEKLAARSAEFRGDLFALRGRVIKIESIAVPSALGKRFDRERIYRCHLQALEDDKTFPVILFTSHVPQQLLHAATLDQRVAAEALFLKRRSDPEDGPMLVFAADRLAWYPDTLLGDLDMDCSLLENVRNGEPLRGIESEAFYQMLAAAHRAAGGELVRRAYNNLVFQTRKLSDEKRELAAKEQVLAARVPQDAANSKSLEKLKFAERLADARLDYIRKNATHPFVPLVETPAQFNGDLIMLRGTAYRIVKVRITEPDIVERFGFDHYYQIDMRVNLEHKVKLVSPASETGGTAREKIVQQHPATFCALGLPEGMPTGDNLLEPVRVAGFYFKNWQYETDEMRDAQAAKRNAPMLIGQQPVWDVRAPTHLDRYGGVIVGSLFLLALIGIWATVWWTGRSDDVFQKEVRAKNRSAGAGLSLAGLESEGAGTDFSYLAEEIPPAEPETPGHESQRREGDHCEAGREEDHPI